MLQQCYDSAITAKSLAQSIKAGAVAPLAIGLSLAVDITLIIAFVTELVRALPDSSCVSLRGTGPEIAELLKKGEIEVALAGSLGETWDRLESWALFTEPYKFVVELNHPLAAKAGGEPGRRCSKERPGRPQALRAHLAEVTAFVIRRSACGRTRIMPAPSPMSPLCLQSNIGVSIMPHQALLACSA